MEETYLIEIRLTRTKWRVKTIISALAERFGVEGFMERHPHVTLFGPFLLRDTGPQTLLDTLQDIAQAYDPVPFTIDGWEKKVGMNGSVLAFTVHPSEELRALTRGISDTLNPVVTSLNAWDAFPDKKWFHVTIANRLAEDQASEIFQKLERIRASKVPDKAHSGFFPAVGIFLARIWGIGKKPVLRPLLIDETGLRITVLVGEEILGEYDLLEKRWIVGEDLHNSECNRKTFADFRKYAGFELLTPAGPGDDIFLIADLHLGHANIIRYCSRPFLFPNVQEMDAVLIRNWNATVSPNSTAYLLGDLRYGNDAPPSSHYREQLAGKVTYIAGNHDDPEPGMIRSADLVYEGRKFLLVHDPSDAPIGFDGWVIHGHHHNNQLAEFPFINFCDRRINVSVEVVGYVPVSLKEITSRIRHAEKTGNNQPVLLRYPSVM
ncbi:MAG: 2'-5' RNA ligase family protein [Methanoregula sp.]|nr:2'-5' RNA ligase family protein [Methanoregula sp.]